ncbi:MAG: 1-acyl-sn-glycerol-3-phosphate acyltransferase [bacterium]|nr:1-acyl-sn-glycerol-3-phosphate acyltransferase [bacterium]
MLFEYDEHPGKTMWASWTLGFIGRSVMRLAYQIRIIPPPDPQRTGPVLIISKHSTEIDIPLGYNAMLQAFGRHAWCVMKASLARWFYLGFFWKIGGIPLDRDNPEKSKRYLQFAKKKLYDLEAGPGAGNMLVLFPEQTTFMRAMGEGKVPGFRFIAGKPAEPLACYPVGFRYEKRKFLRTKVEIEFGEAMYYTKQDDPAEFLHRIMSEVARLSGLTYDFAPPEKKKVKARAGE